MKTISKQIFHISQRKFRTDKVGIMKENATSINSYLVLNLISNLFPEFRNLLVTEVKNQGHDNRSFRLGDEMVVRLPTMECYALAVEKEQKFLPLLAPYISTKIPVPLKMGAPSKDYPFHFSIYKWLEGESASHVTLETHHLEQLALELAKFLKELQSIDQLNGPPPGLHNWYRGDHVSVYDKGARDQFAELLDVIDTNKILELWEQAILTKWQKPPVWIHGDFASTNLLIKDNKLSAVIDFGCMGVGDPACDLVIAWTLFKGKSRDLFKDGMDLDEDTWLRAKAWALWKATFELGQIKDKKSHRAVEQLKIIERIMDES